MGRFAVGRGDAHRRVLAGGGSAADQQRQLVSPRRCISVATFDHLVQRRGDQAGQADGVGALGDRGVQDLRGGDHHAEIDDLVVVAAEDDADDVLADVVHVALDGGEHDLAVARAGSLPDASSFSASM